jgi:hypothetical protein
MTKTEIQTFLEEIAAEFAALPEVSAVVLSGSRGSQFSDEHSDLDLYVYTEAEPSLAWRADLGKKFGGRANIGNNFWEPGDEWVALQSGKVVDIMYRSPAWIKQQFDRVLNRHQASVGYSTCFVYNVLHSQPLFDREGWFATLLAKAQQPYPEDLRAAVIAKNYPVLRSKLSSYLDQITLALERDDLVSINHRVIALLASYFDILFAVNRIYHPGEKRLVTHVLTSCPKRPPDFQTQVTALLSAVSPAGQADIISQVNNLLDGLDDLLIAEQLLPPV